MDKKFDDVDKHIVYELSVDCHQSTSDIADKLDVSPSTVQYRLNNLEGDIIEGYRATVNHGKLGYQYYRIHIQLASRTPEAKETLLDELSGQPNIHYLIATEGKYDILVGVLADSNQSFYALRNELLATYDEAIRSHRIAISIKAPEFAPQYLATTDEAPKPTMFVEDTDTVALDDTDRAVLKAVSTNARKPYVELADIADHPPHVVRYRLKELQESGVVQRFTAKLCLDSVETEAYKTLFSLRGLTPNLETRLYDVGEQHDHVRYMFFGIGQAAFEINTEVPSRSAHRDIVDTFREVLGDTLDDWETLLIEDERQMDYFPDLEAA